MGGPGSGRRKGSGKKLINKSAPKSIRRKKSSSPDEEEFSASKVGYNKPRKRKPFLG